ncbi:MAG TPA: class I SAM-dependent methyltransferase [Burkholderiaceae bacterium]|nr:class I SAM-dependent methyltransferase [Burkholderiaceae bacterium]
MAATSAAERQLSHREVWASKPVLREVYGHLYRRIAAACQPGLTIEVGGGSGNFKQFAPDVLSFDIVYEPWLDFVADAQALPLRSGSVVNIVMLDVLHHIEYPIKFLRDAARVLQPGGRLVFVEPGITPLSGLVYRAMHEEPVDSSVNPLLEGRPNPNKNPYVGNQAIPTLLTGSYAAALNCREPTLDLTRLNWLSLLAYPLSGGFKSWSLITPGVARSLLHFEDRIERVLGPVCGFRLMAVYEKRGGSGTR